MVATFKNSTGSISSDPTTCMENIVEKIWMKPSTSPTKVLHFRSFSNGYRSQFLLIYAMKKTWKTKEIWPMMLYKQQEHVGFTLVHVEITLVRVEITVCVWNYSSCRNQTRTYWNQTRVCVLKNERIFAKKIFSKIFTHACEFHTQTCDFHTFACRVFPTRWQFTQERITDSQSTASWVRFKTAPYLSCIT
jgi:hypothetical protein